MYCEKHDFRTDEPEEFVEHLMEKCNHSRSRAETIVAELLKEHGRA